MIGHIQGLIFVIQWYFHLRRKYNFEFKIIDRKKSNILITKKNKFARIQLYRLNFKALLLLISEVFVFYSYLSTWR